MDAERVAHRVHNLCSTIEALGQELQDAEVEIARLREALRSIQQWEYYVDNPSAWDKYNQECSNLLRSITDITRDALEPDND